MAVLALGFIGSAIGGSIGGTILGVAASTIGGFLGSTIGSMVDNMLFPTKQEGPRLSDLSVQTSTYGNPIPLVWGPENRLAGNVIWSSGLKETSHKTHQGGKGGPSVTTTSYTYSASFAVAVCDCSKRGPIQRIVKIWANKKLVYDVSPQSGTDAGLSAELWSSLTFYNGDFAQTPDPTMEAALGVGNVPAYRGTAYVVIENFQLADYGNRLPSLEFLVEADEEISAASVLQQIAVLCGIGPNQCSTGLVQGLVRGFTIGSASSGTAAIQPLALAYNFDPAQTAGQLRFMPRGLGLAGTIDLEDLAAHAFGEERPSPLVWMRALETQMPRESSVSFPDPERDYQVNSQTARRQAGSADSNLTAQLPIVIDVDTARQLADRLLWEAWVGRTTATGQVDDRWIGMEAGRAYGVLTPAGVVEPVRLKTKTRGANGVTELEFARDRSQVYRSTATGIPSTVPEQVVNVPGPSHIILIDGPILQDADDDTGFYFVVDGLQEGSFRGADVVRSADGGGSYDEVEPVGFESVIGTIDELGSGPSEVFDNVNVIRVTLDDDADELESVTELDVLNGKNVAWVGGADGEDGEILQFKTATLVGAGVYDLSGLLRGRLGTEYAIAAHGSGDRFVLLETGPTRRTDFSAADWNKTRIYKAVSLLTAEADAVPVTFTNTGEGKRPLSPVHVVGTPTVDGLVITWDRRSRYRQPGLGGGPLPLGEQTEAYEIDLYDGVTFLRTLVATGPEVTYETADQVTDGIASGDTVTVRVYQLSDVRGRGRPGLGVLTA